MKRLRIIGLSLLALLALGALLASSASAVEGVLPLNTKTFTLLGGKAELQTHPGAKITATGVAGTGTFENDHHGTALLDFKETLAAGFVDFSLGDKETTKVTEAHILVPVLFLICLINSATLVFGIFIEIKGSPVHIHVKAISDLVEVKGSVIAEIKTVKGKLFAIDVKGKEGLGNIKECKDSEGGVKKALLLSEDMLLEAGKFVESSELVANGTGLVQFTEEQELMDK